MVTGIAASNVFDGEKKDKYRERKTWETTSLLKELNLEER